MAGAIKSRQTTFDPVMEYRPELDGLRAIAVLAVLVHHINPNAMPGGFVGVDIFFVLSGFLITSLIAGNLKNNTFQVMNFYTRRARRLIPAATVMVVIVVVVSAALFLPKDFQDLGASVVAYSSMLSNVLFWRWDNYFAGQNKNWPLLHTWSLSIEEQFYLVSVGKLSKFQFSGLDRSISSREDPYLESAIASFGGHFYHKLRAIADR